MELWFFYALIASLSIGVNGYLVKLMADRKTAGATITFFQGLIYFVFGGLQTVLTHGYFYSQENLAIIGTSILIAIVIFINLRFRVRALFYLSSSEYYIGYRILVTLGLLFTGILFFSETVSLSQLFGLFTGSVAIIFLFEEDKKLRHSRSWKKAISYLFLSATAGVVIQMFGKIQGISAFPFSSMLFYQGVTMLSISLIFDRQEMGKFLFSIKESYKILAILFPATIFVYIAAWYNLLAYHAGGSVSVVTKMLAFSLFIPIFLSIIFSGEKITYKKIIAFILTIVSLFYLT